jgi:hypothetical protein
MTDRKALEQIKVNTKRSYTGSDGGGRRGNRTAKETGVFGTWAERHEVQVILHSSLVVGSRA